MDTAASTRRKPAKPDFNIADDLSWWRTVPPHNVPPTVYGRILGVVCARLERMEFGGDTAGSKECMLAVQGRDPVAILHMAEIAPGIIENHHTVSSLMSDFAADAADEDLISDITGSLLWVAAALGLSWALVPLIRRVAVLDERAIGQTERFLLLGQLAVMMPSTSIPGRDLANLAAPPVARRTFTPPKPATAPQPVSNEAAAKMMEELEFGADPLPRVVHVADPAPAPSAGPSMTVRVGGSIPNRVDCLPAELLRRGRLDEIFAVGLPDPAQRAAVLAIHLRKRGIALDGGAPLAVAASEGYVPAELESAVKDAVVEAHDRGVPVSDGLLVECLQGLVPLSRSFAGPFESMRKWASENARAA